MRLADKIKSTQPRRRSIASHVRENLEELIAARERGVTWRDLATSFRQSGVKVTSHSLRAIFYRVAEERQIDKSTFLQTAEKPVFAGSDAQHCASNVQQVRCNTIQATGNMQQQHHAPDKPAGAESGGNVPPERISEYEQQGRARLRDSDKFSEL